MGIRDERVLCANTENTTSDGRFGRNIFLRDNPWRCVLRRCICNNGGTAFETFWNWGRKGKFLDVHRTTKVNKEDEGTETRWAATSIMSPNSQDGFNKNAMMESAQTCIHYWRVLGPCTSDTLWSRCKDRSWLSCWYNPCSNVPFDDNWSRFDFRFCRDNFWRCVLCHCIGNKSLPRYNSLHRALRSDIWNKDAKI